MPFVKVCETTTWTNHATSGHQYGSLSGTEGEEPPALGDF